MSIFGNNLKEIYPDIRRVAMKLVKYNDADADDLVQKALLKAFEKQESFKGGNLTGWVVTIMKNLFIDDIRKLIHKNIFFNSHSYMALHKYLTYYFRCLCTATLISPTASKGTLLNLNY